MTQARFAVAKYIPDLQRNEPRNIGVLVWTPEAVGARFIGERINGTIEGRTVAPLVPDVSVYKRWVSYWRTQLENEFIDSPYEPEPIPHTSERFLEALNVSGPSHFVLSVGTLFNPVSPEEIGEHVDELFCSLVSPIQGPQAAPRPRSLSVSMAVRRLIRDTGILHDPNFQEDFPLEVPIKARRTAGSVNEIFKFDYAYRNGSLKALYEELPWRDEESFNTKADSIAWMLDNVLEAELISPEKCGVLIRLTPEQLDTPAVGRSLRVLTSFANVYNLEEAREAEAIKGRFSELVAAHQPGNQ